MIFPERVLGRFSAKRNERETDLFIRGNRGNAWRFARFEMTHDLRLNPRPALGVGGIAVQGITAFIGGAFKPATADRLAELLLTRRWRAHGDTISALLAGRLERP